MHCDDSLKLIDWFDQNISLELVDRLDSSIHRAKNDIMLRSNIDIPFPSKEVRRLSKKS